MIVVVYEYDLGGHDCWGRHESNWVNKVAEFDTVEDWLMFKAAGGSDVVFKTLYKVSEKVSA